MRRLTIRVKQILGVSTVIGAAVLALGALHVARISDLALLESQSRAELLANTILHRAREVVPGNADPYGALAADPGLRSILEATIYGANVTDAAILDTTGLVVAHSDRTMVGQAVAERADLAALNQAGTIIRLRTIYAGDGRSLEVGRPIELDGQAFGSIRIGVSTLLIRDALTTTLKPAIYAALAALGSGMVVAALLAQLLLKPIHIIRSGLTRLGKGELDVTLDLPPGDEFGELGSFFNVASRQLLADRSALVGQQANLQSAVEHLEDAVSLFNPAGELIFANRAMQQILGGDLIGRNVVGLWPAGHACRTLVEETFESRRSRGPVHVSLRPSDDTVSTSVHDRTPADDQLVLTHAIVGAEGDLVGVLLTARDFAYLSSMQSTLAYSQKLVRLGRLTAGIAHEVKNPLNAMMIHLELLRTKIRKGIVLAAEGQVVRSATGTLGLSQSAEVLSAPALAALEHVQVIEGEVRRLDEVTQGFLKFSRPEDLRLQDVLLSSLFEEIRPLVQPEALKHGIRLTVECPPSLAVSGDPAMLRQAFLNLAMNACQAMPRGGSLRLVGVAAKARRVEVRVEDTGTGIQPEHLNRIFDLYFTTKKGGTGLGLSMVFRIVQMHDGEVEVESTPGQGTTFRVLLPSANGS